MPRCLLTPSVLERVSGIQDRCEDISETAIQGAVPESAAENAAALEACGADALLNVRYNASGGVFEDGNRSTAITFSAFSPVPSGSGLNSSSLAVLQRDGSWGVAQELSNRTVCCSNIEAPSSSPSRPPSMALTELPSSSPSARSSAQPSVASTSSPSQVRCCARAMRELGAWVLMSR